MGVVLGIDVSTTATKAVVLDAAGAVLAIGTSAYGFDQPHPLWSEQDPHLWWTGATEAIGRAMAAARRRPADVEGVGLTGQMHGLVLLDAAGEVLRPAILWNDQRTAAECDEIRETVGKARLVAITGNDALTGFTAPKLAWVRGHEPEVWARVAHVLLPKDYVRYRLTGDYALDKADGAGTILFDLAARDWSPVMLEALGIDPAWMPPTFEGPQVTGVVSEAAAAATGLRAGTPVMAGGGDQAANAVGVGAVVPGRVALSLGTSGVVFATTDRPAVRARGPRARLLPRRAGPLAHDVGDALGGGQPALVPRRDRAGRRVRRPRGRRGRGARGAATGSCSCPTCPASAARTPIRWRAARSSG